MLHIIRLITKPAKLICHYLIRCHHPIEKRLNLQQDTLRIIGLLIVIICAPPIMLITYLPLIILLLAGLIELTIKINTLVVGKPPSYSMHTPSSLSSKTNFNLAKQSFYDIKLTEASNRQHYYDSLVYQYSPTVLQEIGYQPLWDIPVAVNFDGDWNTRNNVKNAERSEHINPVVYGEVIAETEDSYYLAYMFYHIKDYDQPLREWLTFWTYHDNDNEGLQLRIEKSSMQIKHIETWYHNRFFICKDNLESKGSEPVQSIFLTEAKTHPIIFSQSLGHGIRCAFPSDLDKLEQVKVFRVGAPNQQHDYKLNRDNEYLQYNIASLKPWYEQAKLYAKPGEESASLFEGEIKLSENNNHLSVGRFFAGVDYNRNAWSRPKPPWSWDDMWDEIPIGIWHFHPSYAFSSHTGEELSHKYVYNAPITNALNITSEEFIHSVGLKQNHFKSDKWNNLSWREELVSRSDIWKRVKIYINSLFMALG